MTISLPKTAQIVGLFLISILIIRPNLSLANEIGTNDFRVSQMLPDGVESIFAHNVDIAHNTSNGDYLVVWTGNTPSTEIENWAQRYDKNGNAIGSTIRISAFAPDGFDSCRNVLIGDCPAYYAHKPAVAYNSDLNEYLIVYAGRQTNMHNPNHLWGRRISFDPLDGTPIIGSQYIVSDLNGTGDYLNISSINPDLAYNTVQNKYLVVFSMDISNSEQSTRLNIKGRVLDNDGTPMGGSHFAIGTHRATGGSANAKVAYNANDDQYLVVWTFWDSVTIPGVSNDREIYGRLVNGDGSLISQSDIRISHTLPDNHNSYYAFHPNLAYNPQQNNYLVVWLAAQTDWEIFGQFISTTGQEIGSDFQISEMGPDEDRNYIATEPNIAYNNQTNQFLVVWSGEDLSASITGDDQEIFGQVLSATGVQMGEPDFRISDMGQDGDVQSRANSPAAMFNPDKGEYLVVWDGRQLLSGPDYEREIYGQRLQLSPTTSGPQITDISPNSGLISGGFPVTISGFAFMPNAEVRIGGNIAPVNSLTANQIVVTAPAGSEGAQDVVVTNPDSGTGTVSGGFHYTNPPPTLTSVTPPHGPTVGGTVITIQGTGFLNNPPPTVEFGFAGGTYVAATNVNFISSTELDVTIPPYTGQVDIRVTNRDTAFAVLPNSFWFMPHFTVRTITPNSGPAIGGIQFSIIGEFLIPETEVYFGNQLATNVTYVSGFELTAVTPAGTPGLTDVSVRSVGRPDVHLTNAYEYLPPPTLGEPFRISNMEPDGSISYTGKNSAVAYNSQDDEYLVVWRGVQQGRSGYEIYGQRLDSAGNEIGELNFRISDMDPPGNITYKAHSPAVVYNSHQNEYFVAWAGIDDNGSGATISEIFGQRLSANGTLLESTDIQISQTGYGGIAAPPAPGLAYNSVNDQYLVVWSNQSEIFGQRIEGSNGNEIGTNDFRISEMGDSNSDGYHAFEPAVAHHPDPQVNRYVVVWRGDNNTGQLTDEEYEIYGQILNSRGEERLTDDFRISMMGPDGNRSFEAAMPAVAANPNNDEFLVTWQGEDNTGNLSSGEYEIYGRRINANAQMMSNQFRISQLGPDGGTSFRALDSKVIFDTSDNEFMVVWKGQIDLPSSEQHDYEIFGQRLSPGGIEVGQDDFQISDAGPSGSPSWQVFNPSIALNTNNGNVFVSWFGEDDIHNLANNEHEVYGVLLNIAGSPNPDPEPDPDPTLDRVSPLSGPLEGGNSVSLFGTHFDPNASVEIGGNEATIVNRVADTQIDVIAPPGTEGPKLIRVLDPPLTGAGVRKTAGITDGYTYVTGPIEIIGLDNQVSGPIRGGTNISILIRNFTGGVTATVGGLPLLRPSFEDVGSNKRLWGTTQPDVFGFKDVVITDADGQTDTLVNGFEMVAPPVITNVSPNSGPTTGGTDVILTGQHFRPEAQICFGTIIPPNSTYVSSTEWHFTTPNGSLGPMLVCMNNGFGTTSFPDAFTYTAPPPPFQILSIAPASGPLAGGTNVTISGNQFDSNTTVQIGGNDAMSVVWVNDTTLTAMTPPGSAGAADVVVDNQNGDTDTLTGGFTYSDTPLPFQINTIVPNSGPADGGTSVTIVGSGFDSNTRVRIGGNDATAINWISATQLTANTPAGIPGPKDVEVYDLNNRSDTLVGGFDYDSPIGAPRILSITPDRGPAAGGTRITILGQNFDLQATITVGGLSLNNVLKNGSTEIRGNTLPGQVGPADVTVTNVDGQAYTAVGGFIYEGAGLPPPTITSISPNIGPESGGTSVVVTGNNFQTGARVLIGGQFASGEEVESPTRITALTPAGTGTNHVEVRNPDGQNAEIQSAFTYVASVPNPGLSDIFPYSGPTAGGTFLSLVGSNFTSNTIVMFGGVEATVVNYLSDTRIDINTPPGTEGLIDVEVINPGAEQSAVLRNIFRYIGPPPPPPPTVSQVTPFEGPLDGGTSITINGSNFQAGVSVTIDGNPATNVTIVTPSIISAVTPAGSSAGSKTVRVTNPDSEFGELSGGFTYFIPAPNPIETIKNQIIGPPGGTINFNPITGPIVVDFPSNSFEQDTTVTLQPSTELSCAQPTIANYRSIGVGLDITLDRSVQPGRMVSVTISYQDSDVSNIDEGSIMVVRCDEARGVWVPLQSIPDPANNRVQAYTSHFSIFQLMVPVAAQSVDTGKIFPNPFRKGQGFQHITFTTLPSNATIQIFSRAGELVKTLTSDHLGEAIWNATNDSGSNVAAGIYFVHVEGAGSDRTMKIAIMP